MIIVEWDKPYFKNQQSSNHNIQQLTIDSLSNNFISNRIGAQWRSNEIISYEDEHLFWAKESHGIGLP